MTVHLRAHHLLCMLTFVGEGYTPAFTENYIRIARRLSSGEEIEVVDGPDDICAPLLSGAAAHCHNESVVARDEAAAEAVGRLLGVKVGKGTRIRPDAALLKRLRRNFALGTIRKACSECEWSELCGHVAERGFADVLVAPG
ncbi:DUF1284 domain-containing protein [Rhizobium sp. S152]|uniref:DUF1284 domain-containing protein n=1 Tax=Rhizobium sp. S152 TaxID=3055038 RepID=UPI0025AA057A|nr:DUF1284 domain-containing protein [Rhizobium sp. S152]MDM9626697.1 DUF1284 domain-containing protein [Rhizobium sp. S152]